MDAIMELEDAHVFFTLLFIWAGASELNYLMLFTPSHIISTVALSFNTQMEAKIRHVIGGVPPHTTYREPTISFTTNHPILVLD